MLHPRPVPPCSASAPTTPSRLSGAEAVIIIVITLVAAHMTLAGLSMRRVLELTASAAAIAVTISAVFRVRMRPVRRAVHILATAIAQSR